MARSNTKYILILLLLWIVMVVNATSYREKYAAVLTYYQQKPYDRQKYDAALFLIDYMGGHQSPEGAGIRHFIQVVKNFKPKTDIGKLNRAWQECHKNATTKLVPDSSIISSEQLISNIDDAFDMWRSAPWYKDVSFELFCQYVLPYRVSNEHLSLDWRNTLRDAYQDKLQGVTDIKEAFAILRREVLSRVKNSHTFTPFNLDPLTYQQICRANCDQRCILLASVLRSFAIPAAIDVVPYWADYSTMGHAWVSLVLGEGQTYTAYEDDDYPHMNNKIDASVFLKDDSVIADIYCPYQIKKEKRVAKIYRTTYMSNRMDVSGDYGLNGTLQIFCDTNDTVYLCIYQTGKDWYPIAQTKATNGKAVFEHLGKGVVYLPTTMLDGRLYPLSTPVLLDENGNARYYSKACNDTCTIVINRKYPLCSYMPAQWRKLEGSVIEGADNPLFNKPDTLYFLGEMPYGTTQINLNNKKHYQYVRFKSPNKEIALLSELYFMGTNGEPVNGHDISDGVDTNRIEFLHDGDKETKIKALKPGYWVGIQLIKSQDSVSTVSFTPVSDGNGIQSGHLYELYAFDTYWHLMDRVYARNNDSLIFHHVPQGMLLLLKDRTKGHEERIFEYKNKQQIWY